jgi:hypothetical protein
VIEKVQKLVGLTPWEEEYQRQQREATYVLFTRSQWRGKGKMVICSDEEAAQILTTKTGHVLRLFNSTQVRERTEAEKRRDGMD